MTNPSKKGIDLNLVEEEFTKVMGLLEADEDDVFYDAPSPSELNIESQSVSIDETFVDCELDEEEEEEEQISKEQLLEEQNLRLRNIDGLYNTFSGWYGKKLIAQVLDKHNGNVDLVIEELGAALCVGKVNHDPTPHSPKTVYAPETKIVFNKKARRAHTRSKANRETMEDAINIADRLANTYKHNHRHHMESSRRYGINDPRAKGILVVARSEKQLSIDHENVADILRAAKVVDSLDLHGWPVERGLRFVEFTIDKIKKNRPNQQRLELIVGRGNNNPKKKAVMKEAVMQWLRRMDIRFELVDYNPGVVNVDLLSVK